MSLRVDDRSSRARGRSPSGARDRSRSRSNVRAPEMPLPPAGTYGYAPNDSPTSYDTRSPPSAVGNRSDYFPQSSQPPGSYPAVPTAPAYPPAPGYPPAPSAPYPKESDDRRYSNYNDYPPSERPGYHSHDSYSSQTQRTPDGYRGPEAGRYSRHNSYDEYPPQQREPDRYGRQNSYESYPPEPPRQPLPPQAPKQSQLPGPGQYSYHTPEPTGPDSRSPPYKYQYSQPPEKVTYNTHTPRDEQSYGQYPPSQGAERGYPQQRTYPQNTHEPQRAYSQSTHDQPQRQHSSSGYDQTQRTYSQNTQEQQQRTYSQSNYDNANVVDITPYDHRGSKSGSTAPRPSIDHRTSGGLSAPGAGALAAPMGLLSVGGQKQITAGGELPPPSPLLEAYRGTYQQMSPLPLALRPADEDELSDFEPLSPTITKKGVKIDHKAIIEKEKKERRVKVYDPEDDAKTISKALNHSNPKGEPICDILPVLTHDQIMYLRKEYKKQVKIQGKGVNLSKHLKTKLSGNFGKVAYVTALGRWESEGYWANFFYQSHGSRRELLIESLMGRSNGEIWNIKDEFKDKRYSDDLVKCMEKELKMDKFRTAVLMVLEERRQEEQDVYPTEYRLKDVETLHKALTAPKGGESTMLEIIILRSDAHLREVLKMYEATYRENFPRAALKKSNNLVGEVIAHVLNGVINKPARDALLLRHAIEDVAEKNKEEELRYELLISRLVRFHWDKMHLMRVKREYYNKYGKHVEEEIEEATKGDFGEFLCQLCETKGA